MRRFRDTDLDELLAPARDRPNGVLEPFKAYLNARFAETQGQANGTRLFLEIRERGHRGRRQVVRKHLAALRAGTTEPVRVDIPSPREITGWIMRPRDTLTESQDQRLLQVRLACPYIARACDFARTSPISSATGADTLFRSGSARPSRTPRSRCTASPTLSAGTSTPSPQGSTTSTRT
ncbi:hypothetical protein ACFXPY_19695 [Streptomyces sp. NPDC059153]|uniref:hypothetical protein n=1 Tax=unclassified Streptomyces TaxID=2593676 RepID=UPI0036B8754A